MSKIDRIKELVQLLNKARKAYYVESNEIMSNKQYDKQYEELENLEKETGVIYNNSPTQNIGYEVKDTLVKIKHPEPMLSLGKTKDPNEMLKFLGDKEGILSWKLDGLTLVLEYEDGKLKSAVTRGNGEVGTDVLHIAKTIINLPQNIAYKGKLIIRGECVVSYPDFAEINIDNKYQNPRNLASGTLMLLDANIARNRNLKWIAFNLVQANIDFNNSFEEQFKWLKSLGFDTVGYKKVNKDNLLETIKWFDDEIKNYDIPSDGLVLVFNDLKYRDKLGSTIHEPLGWKAFKWKDNTVETILKDIQFNMGRTGVLTPVAVFNPIELESTTVTRASIHNLNILKSLQLGIGDKIEVYKANKIIPQIYDNLTRSDTFIIPNQCPYCGSNTTAIKTDGGEFLYCFNKDCVSKKIQQFAHFVSRNAMNIIGLSDKSIEKFIDLGFLKDLPDIYKLEQYKNQIINL
ncbi:MAG: NAD-dependent DNA ligase LigA, partial [Bacillota bacterium]|nr:NAD-dependent DNA ligase LigA [Bacillota bacterium]